MPNCALEDQTHFVWIVCTVGLWVFLELFYFVHFCIGIVIMSIVHYYDLKLRYVKIEKEGNFEILPYQRMFTCPRIPQCELLSWVWWCIPVTQQLRRQRQEGLKFKDNCDCT